MRRKALRRRWSAERIALEAQGAEFSGDVEDMGFGLAVSMKGPGADEILVYQPKHPEAHSLRTWHISPCGVGVSLLGNPDQ